MLPQSEQSSYAPKHDGEEEDDDDALGTLMFVRRCLEPTQVPLVVVPLLLLLFMLVA